MLHPVELQSTTILSKVEWKRCKIPTMSVELGGKEFRFRFEPLDEWFFPAPVYVDGHVCPAPPEAQEKYAEMAEGWLMNHPKTVEKPVVKLHPVQEEGRVGYIVQIGIVYPPGT